MISGFGRADLFFSFASSAKNSFVVFDMFLITLGGMPSPDMTKNPMSVHACATRSATSLRTFRSPVLNGDMSIIGTDLRAIACSFDYKLAQRVCHKSRTMICPNGMQYGM